MVLNMNATQREKSIYGKDVKIVSRSDDCTVYQIGDEKGGVKMKSYQVFPGIELIYNDVRLQKCLLERPSLGHIFEINHCLVGRIECEFQDEFFYLSEGDLAVSRKDGVGHESYFPLSRYYGITIMIDADKAPECLSCILDDVNVRPAVLAEKFCGINSCFVARSGPEIEHIFLELYSVPNSIRKGYFKVKILELLLFLSGMDPKKYDSGRRCYSRIQVSLAKEVCKYLTEHMDSRVTLEQLSEIFHVSGTQLKNSFKGVYGVSIYSYIRAQKMQAAALTLRQTNQTVLEVAGKYGYDNGSKFAKAFKDIMGMTPNQYRRKSAKSTVGL